MLELDEKPKVTSQKGYAGQVTCKCEHGEKKEEKKEEGGCCSRKERKAESGCCGAKCCTNPKEQRKQKKLPVVAVCQAVVRAKTISLKKFEKKVAVKIINHKDYINLKSYAIILNSNDYAKKLLPENFSSRRIGDAKEINNHEGTPQIGCCSWRQTCCGGGCCEQILPNCCSSEQNNATSPQKAMVAPTYGYTPWEMTMNGTMTMTSVPGNNEIEKLLCSNLSKPTVCYGGGCGKTPSQDSNTKNKKEEETRIDTIPSRIRISNR
ncbi:S-adenosyl-L-methionine-dependent tRNA 4-demethylwyosine synthase-like isoform X3 [Vespula squamosa]|uniref:S-adenosyl-L-methionine-dependent tRNA 4-demethylwyosine synthase-like isoform X3 n=1 Tax=Vespula squamosa TaxID=30214 RepID=A0ABD2BYQ8_VESSQ